MPVIVSALALLACASVASAEEQTSSRGAVTATFSFESQDEPYGFTDLWLTITRAGQVLYQDAPRAGDCEEPFCFPGGGSERHSVRVRDLDGDGEPEVLLDLFTGGAHCCLWVRIFAFDGTRYGSLQHNFADPGYRLGDIDDDGVPELVSSDARFAYRYASFAASWFPLRIWKYDRGGLIDVTARYPQCVRADAKRAWHGYRKALRGHNTGEPRGAISAWAADRYLLGARKSTLRRLQRLARHHWLPGTFPTSQKRFVAKLDRDLRRLGYIRGTTPA